MRTTARAFADKDIEAKLLKYTTSSKVSTGPPGLFRRFIRRFFLGLPVVGAGAAVQMLNTVPFGFTWARRGARRSNNQNNRDVAAILLVVMVLIGSAK